MSDGRVHGACRAASIDPYTLSIGPVLTGNCGDPGLYRRAALPIAYSEPAPPGPGVIAVRMATADVDARDGYTLGPVITKWTECSDCQAAWIAGDGALWLYNPDPLSRSGRSGAVLLRISPRTGRVLERWQIPQIVRPLLAVNSAGLWLSPSVESGVPGGVSAARLGQYTSLYRIAPGDPQPVRVLTEHDNGARWLVANGSSASTAIIGPRGSTATIWTFDRRRRATHAQPRRDICLGNELGVGQPTVAGDAKMGFYAVMPGNAVEQVNEATTNSGCVEPIATFRLPHASTADGQPGIIFLHRSLFFLDPATGATGGSTVLHSVTAQAHRGQPTQSPRDMRTAHSALSRVMSKQVEARVQSRAHSEHFPQQNGYLQTVPLGNCPAI